MSDKQRTPVTPTGRWMLSNYPQVTDVVARVLRRQLADVEREASAAERLRIREWVDDHDWQGAEGHIVFYDALVSTLSDQEEHLDPIHLKEYKGE